MISSLYAVFNGVLSTPYAMSKVGVEAFGRSLRVELAGTGVDVGIAYFGFIDTKLVRDAFVKPGITELRNAFPKFVAEPVPVERAGVAIVKGVRRRVHHASSRPLGTCHVAATRIAAVPRRPDDAATKRFAARSKPPSARRHTTRVPSAPAFASVHHARRRRRTTR